MKRVLLAVFILASVAANAVTIVGEPYKGNVRAQVVYQQPAQDFGTQTVSPSAPKALYTTTYDNMPMVESPMQAVSRKNSSPWEDTEVDPGNPMPVGDPWIMLLFAAVAAVGIRIKMVRNSRAK